jgi:hypothetical protein
LAKHRSRPDAQELADARALLAACEVQRDCYKVSAEEERELGVVRERTIARLLRERDTRAEPTQAERDLKDTASEALYRSEVSERWIRLRVGKPAPWVALPDTVRRYWCDYAEQHPDNGRQEPTLAERDLQNDAGRDLYHSRVSGDASRWHELKPSQRRSWCVYALEGSL